MRPGGVLAIPLAFGDMEMAAAGTITDILPDGTVLGFGHAMFGQGPMRVPMASGYVNFIASLRTISFKNAGALQLTGSIVQDEQFAVAGVSDQVYHTIPMTIRVEKPGVEAKTYQYRVVEHPMLVGQLAMGLTMMSISTIQESPMLNTMAFDGVVSLVNGQEIPFADTLANGEGIQVGYSLMPLIQLPILNPFDSVSVESVTLNVRVEAGSPEAVIAKASLSQPSALPGQQVTAHVTLRRFGQPEETVDIPVRVPANAPAGQASVILGDASLYTGITYEMRPHRTTPTDIDGLIELLREVSSIPSDRVYALLAVEDSAAIAIGSEEYENLPSSRASVLMGASRSNATVYSPQELTSQPVDGVVSGLIQLPLTVLSNQADAP